MEVLQKSNVHGPVDQQFVSEKFKASPGRSQPGTYLVRRDCNDHFKYLLHYMTEKEGIKVVQISNESGMFKILGYLDSNDLKEGYDEIGQLIKNLASHLGLKTCLHPSEFDRAQSLLICRSVSATEADIIGPVYYQSFVFFIKTLTLFGLNLSGSTYLMDICNRQSETHVDPDQFRYEIASVDIRSKSNQKLTKHFAHLSALLRTVVIDSFSFNQAMTLDQ